MIKLPGGIWPVMLTPFREDGGIDYTGLASLTDFYIESGAAGLFVNCLSSEMYMLSPEERIALTGSVVRIAAGRVPVVSTGTFSTDPDENLEFMRMIHNQGVIGVVINTNQLCDATEGEKVFRNRLENLVRATGEMPLGIYECPEPYKRLLSTDLIAWMASSGRFGYFKDTCCDNHRIRSRVAASENSPFALYNAHTPTGMQSLRDGASGLSPIGANFYPELYRYLYESTRLDHKAEFPEAEQFLLLNDPVVHAGYPFSAKWFLRQRGLPISTQTRTPVRKLGQEESDRLHQLLSGMKELFEMTGVTSSISSGRK